MSKITELKEISSRLVALIKELAGEENGENTTDFGVVATSELAGVEIAGKNYAEGGKKHFTWEDACAIEKKLNNGWRLPTRSEWALICEEFGQKDGKLDAETLINNLKLERGGYLYDGSLYVAGYYGYYWSSTPYSIAGRAYNLYFDSGVDPSDNTGRYGGLSVRLVRDVKDERD